METMYIDSLREWKSGVVVNRGGLWRYRLATSSCRRQYTNGIHSIPEGKLNKQLNKEQRIAFHLTGYFS